MTIARTSPRILFDEDFDLPPRPDMPVEPEIIEPSFTVAEMETCRAEGWADGYARGRADLAERDNAEARETLALIGIQVRDAAAQASRQAEDVADSLARLLLDTLGALFPALRARFGETEILGVVRTVLPALRQEPKATIRLPPASAARVAREIERLEPDLMGAVEIIAEPTMAPDDIRIAWRNGSAVRDGAAIWRDVAEILGQAGWPLAPTRVMETIDGE